MTFYLKYRPQTVSELDLVSVRETLTNLLKKDSIPHAFLFAGPKGTGKTSAARIVAKAINCENKKKDSFEPCNKCSTCLAITKGNHIDVIEMDAASNRGIDEVRALKQEIMLSPSISPKKVYIIDEVHMLTTEAANALLKTLEEPPSHVVFILATTDPQKLPQTVVSRLSLVQFHKASSAEIQKKLALIAKSEKIIIEDGVFGEIAHLADGSFRDAVKKLEELSLAENKITLKQVEEKANTGENSTQELFLFLKTKEVSASVNYVEELSRNGVDGKAFLNAFIAEVHVELLKNYAPEDIKLLELLLEAKTRLPFSPNDFLPLEIAISKFKPAPLPLDGSAVKKTENVLNDSAWAKILLALKAKNAGVEGLLRAGKPIAFDENSFKVGVYYKFHKERLETPAYRKIFEDTLFETFGNKLKAQFFLEEPPVRAVPEPSLTYSSEPDIIKAAEEIFST